MRIQNREELDQIRDMAAAKVSSTKCRILICAEQDVLLVVLEKFMRKCVNSRKIVKMLM